MTKSITPSEAVSVLDITKDIQSLTTLRRNSGVFYDSPRRASVRSSSQLNGKAPTVVQDAQAYQHRLDRRRSAGNMIYRVEVTIRAAHDPRHAEIQVGDEPRAALGSLAVVVNPLVRGSEGRS
jgi:hypothetical protein